MILHPPGSPYVEISGVLSRRWERCTGRDLRAALGHAEHLERVPLVRWLAAVLGLYGSRLDSEPKLTLGQLAAELGVAATTLETSKGKHTASDPTAAEERHPESDHQAVAWKWGHSRQDAWSDGVDRGHGVERYGSLDAPIHQDYRRSERCDGWAEDDAGGHGRGIRSVEVWVIQGAHQLYNCNVTGAGAAGSTVALYDAVDIAASRALSGQPLLAGPKIPQGEPFATVSTAATGTNVLNVQLNSGLAAVFTSSGSLARPAHLTSRDER